MLKRARKHRAGTAAYATGRERVEEILDAARHVFIEGGYARFTMRRVAARAGVSVGNLSYYYTTKQDLLADLLDSVIMPYIERFEDMRHAAGATSEDQLRAVLALVLRDLGTRDTTLFFPELWALANRDRNAARQMENMYERYRAVVADIVAGMNPELSRQRCRELSLFITSAIEGLTVFVGHGRPHRTERKAVSDLAVDTFVDVIKRG